MGYQISLSNAIKLSKDFGCRGKNVVFTHGTFDLFHSGHSYLLDTSKKDGDILMVCVEPDSNIKKYKHQLRPIIGQEHRANILVHHTAVDFVFINDEIENLGTEYYLNLYKHLKPKIVTVGSNFSNQERSKIRLKGIQIKEIQAVQVEVNNTTQIITRIIDSYK